MENILLGKHSGKVGLYGNRSGNGLRLSIAIGEYDRTRALLNGSLGIDGVDPIFMTLEPEEIFFRAFRNQDFDVCELSLSSYTLQVATEGSPYIGIPAFVSRAFRHTCIYVRKDRIKTPSDLIGARVGIPEYQLTAHVWLRALLADDYGVRASDIKWVRGGIEEPTRHEKIKLNLPRDISVEIADGGLSLNEMLVKGEIDALVAPRAPSSFANGAPNIGWLFDDPIETIGKYYARSGVFPIMHIVGVRRELAETYPFLPVALYKAFEQARAIAVERLSDVTALRTSFPFSEVYIKQTRALMGHNFWSYGVTPENRKALDIFLMQHHEQGLSPRRLAVEELFHPSTYELVKI